MRKIQLLLESLTVESFDTSVPAPPEGTVVAHQLGSRYTCGFTCEASCIQTCTCPGYGTCLQSCNGTCEQSCGSPSCFGTCFTCPWNTCEPTCGDCSGWC
jgi:hypothetical protein